MSDPFEKKVADFIKSRNLFASRENILLAVSGGADSVALTFALKRIVENDSLNTRLKIAHINHNLRGDSSDCDEQFVIDLAAKLSLEVFTRSVDVRAFASEHKLSIETAARTLRIDTLARIADDTQCEAVATAHHADDNAETIVHRLLRGTGFRGLAGIAPENTLTFNTAPTVFIRPLLGVTRDEIIEYCRTNEIPWRHDHTNDDHAFTRNRIRHLLLPQLQQDSERSVTELLMTLSRNAHKLTSRIERTADTAWTTVIKQSTPESVTIDKTLFSQLHELIAAEIARRALISIGCGQRNLSEYHYKNILQISRTQHAAKISLPQGCTACADRQYITFEKLNTKTESTPDIQEQTLNIPGTTRCANHTIEATLLEADHCDIEQFKTRKSNLIEWFDYDKLTSPLTARSRKPGDRFCPIGMASEKKIGKFLTAARIDTKSRNRLFVIADTEKIIWLAPLRPSETTRVTAQTRQILQIQIAS